MKLHRFELSENKYIEFLLIRKNVKNINLTVRPDFSIMVSAKPTVPLDDIYSFIDSKSTWIKRQIGKFKTTQTQNNIEKEYVSGETFKYLGKQYRLEVNLTSSVERVFIEGEFIVMLVKNKDKKSARAKLLDEWYRKEASRVFNESLDSMYELVKYNVDFKPDLQFKVMKKRWGSCLRTKKTILLNLELMKAPTYCIDYVVLHELIHFIHKNHNEKFYELLTVLMPDWKFRKEILDEEIVLFV